MPKWKCTMEPGKVAQLPAGTVIDVPGDAVPAFLGGTWEQVGAPAPVKEDAASEVAPKSDAPKPRRGAH